jgi:hypothetical protein
MFQLIAAVLCASALHAQVRDRLDGVLDLKWGDSPERVKTVMLKRDGVSLDPKYDNDDRIVFDGGKFAGRSVIITYCSFLDGKLYKVSILLKANPNRLPDDYDSMKKLLVEKYGSPDEDFRFFERPYSEEDAYSTLPFKLEKATFAAYWGFPPKAKTGGGISVEITKNLSLRLSYYDKALEEKAVEKNKQKNKEDL